jgi:hypothetical protein
MVTAVKTWPHLLSECIGKGLNAKLEGAKVRRFVQLCHLLWHQGLMEQFSLGIVEIHYIADSVNSVRYDDLRVHTHDQSRHG